MGQVKCEPEEMVYLEMTESDEKECLRCLSMVSVNEYYDNNGLCNYCITKISSIPEE